MITKDSRTSVPDPLEAGPGGGADARSAWDLAVRVRRTSDGPVVQSEPLRAPDLNDLRGELWLDAVLRRGHPEIPLEGLNIRVSPIFQEAMSTSTSPRCVGVELELRDHRNEAFRRTVTVDAFSDAAARAAARARAGGQLAEEETYYYDLVAVPRPDRVEDPGADALGLVLTWKPPSLDVVRMPLPPLRRHAEPIGPADDPASCPVFFTRAALARAERFARQGAEFRPPIETGAVLVGVLGSCPETGEFFVLVADALEATDADGSGFSLEYTSKTWTRLQAVLRAMRTRPATRACRIVGQCHGHNFPPGEAPPCEQCHKVKVCSRSSVFVSVADRDWSRAVFNRQPWQLCHIFGLNARGEGVQALFGLRGNRLVERGYYVLPDEESPSLVDPNPEEARP
jgi:hypothetical protein